MNTSETGEASSIPDRVLLTMKKNVRGEVGESISRFSTHKTRWKYRSEFGGEVEIERKYRGVI